MGGVRPMRDIRALSISDGRPRAAPPPGLDGARSWLARPVACPLVLVADARAAGCGDAVDGCQLCDHRIRQSAALQGERRWASMAWNCRDHGRPRTHLREIGMNLSGPARIPYGRFAVLIALNVLALLAEKMAAVHSSGTGLIFYKYLVA